MINITLAFSIKGLHLRTQREEVRDRSNKLLSAYENGNFFTGPLNWVSLW
jgi:hypothetical protein